VEEEVRTDDKEFARKSTTTTHAHTPHAQTLQIKVPNKYWSGFCDFEYYVK